MSQLSIPKSAAVLHYARELVTKAGRRGFWAMADQAVVSLGNFATIVAVARTVSKESYGTFGLMLDALFFLISLHAAVVTYPLTLRGAVADEASLKRLATGALALTFLLAIPITLAGLLVGGATRVLSLSLAAVPLLLMWQSQETLRRGLMAHLRHRDALWGDAVTYLGMAACAWTLRRADMLSLHTLFVSMACCYAAGVVVQAMELGLARVTGAEVKRIARDFWDAGRWVLLTNLSVLAITLCGVGAMTIFHGRAETGVFYAMGNFLKLTNPLMISFAGLIVPAAARLVVDQGPTSALRTSAKYSILGLALVTPYYLLLLAFPSQMIRLVYGADTHFAGGETVLRLFAVGSVVQFILVMSTAYLNGIHRSKHTFYAQVVNLVGTVLVMLPLTIRWGALGQTISGPIVAAVQVAVLTWFIARITSEDRASRDPQTSR